MGKLTAIMVNKVKEKGCYPDGGNLYLQVSSTGAKSWLFRYMINGKAKNMGLGALNAVSLAEAREKAADARRLIVSGIDPQAEKKAEKQKAKLEDAKKMTFEQCAVAYIDAHKTGWKNAKHIWQWENTLTRFVYPVFGKLPVQDIDVALVLKVLEPIWKTKTETANRVRGRIERVLDWASSREYRIGENPARWRGKLENLLPAPSKIKKVVHQPALPYVDISDFMAELATKEGLGAIALQLTILTATRTSETLNAKWSEFDLKKGIWIIPAERMKAGKEHRIPLSDPALKILKNLHEAKINDFVFPSKKDKPLSNMAMMMLVRRMERTDFVVHGFRSTFRDWAAEQTNYAWEVAEISISHTVGSKVEAAYRRGDLFEKRQRLMNEWARYCYMPQPKEGCNILQLGK
jgi:integrase